MTAADAEHERRLTNRIVDRAGDVAVSTYVNTEPVAYDAHELAADTADPANHGHWRHIDGDPVEVRQ